MAVGFPAKTTYVDGDVFSASDINDTNGTLNLLTTSTLSQAAGKNAIINGGFDVWQRGTSFTPNGLIYMADRWEMYVGATGTTVTRQTTSDTTNLPFIQYCMRVSRDSGNSGTNIRYLYQPMETVNSIPLAGKDVTFSFYARKGATFAGSVVAKAGTGTGTDQNALITYTGQATAISATPTLTTTWQRFTYTGTFAATATEVYVGFEWTPSGTAGATDYFEVTGIQLELGSVATTFARNSGTIQGELAACQRYYYRITAVDAPYANMGQGQSFNATSGTFQVPIPVTMRAVPSSVEFSTLRASEQTLAQAVTALTISANATNRFYPAFSLSVASGLNAGRFYTLEANNSTSAYIGINAEL